MSGSSASSFLGDNALLMGLGVGLTAGLLHTTRHRGATRFRGRRRAKTQVLSLEKNLDAIETAISDFVPKISALRSEAEKLRSGVAEEVVGEMEHLRKTELKGLFGEVDRVLCALSSATHALKDSADTIRIRQGDEGMHSDDSEDTMMEVHVVGLSHHSAPVEVREKLSVPEASWRRYANDLVKFARTPYGPLIPEVAVLSTCNRFEIYFSSPESKKLHAVDAVYRFLATQSGMSREDLEPYLFARTGADATQHLFQVSSGLDSIVLGEGQILAQVKSCYSHCIGKKADEEEEDGPQYSGCGGKIIAGMLQRGVRMGKMARSKTQIGVGAVSVSSAAVELMAERSEEDLGKPASETKVCVIGAGKMSRLCLIALLSKYPKADITVVNRTVATAEALLEEVRDRAEDGCKLQAVPCEKMWDAIGESDVVFTASSCKDPFITPAKLQGRKEPLMLVDIAVPRNIATGCEKVDGVLSYTVDDLKKIMAANNEARQEEARKVQEIVDVQVEDFKNWKASQGAVPYLIALQDMAEDIRLKELKRAEKRLGGGDKERELMDIITKGVIKQMLQPIYASIRENEETEEKRNKLWALKSLFQLNTDGTLDSAV